MERSLIILMLMVLIDVLPTKAQSDDFGVWIEAGVEKKLSKKWSVDGGLEYRTRNHSQTMARWSSLSLGAEYKITKFLKASAGYVLLFDNNPEELDMKSDGLTPNKWTPSFWSVRLGISLRERWQYTYRPEAIEKRYDIDEGTWTNIKGKGKNVLRSRLQLSYDIPHWKFDPFVSAEAFNANSGLQKTRYTVGVDYKLQKKHNFSLNYKYQRVNNDDDDMESNCHVLGVSYKYKF